MATVCVCGDIGCTTKTGTCHCGCGGQTRLAWPNHPRVFIRGHQRRKTPVPTDEPIFYVEGEPCRKIPLHEGIFVIVDEHNYLWLMKWKWSIAEGRNTCYAYRSIQGADGRRRPLSMHRLIMGCPTGLEVDHRNGQGLDNRRSNLRNATPQQQRQNMGLYSRNNTGFAGVQKDRQGKFRARIRVNKREIWLGRYATIEEAAAVRAQAERHFRGDWSRSA